jgi:hypothetical protein
LRTFSISDSMDSGNYSDIVCESIAYLLGTDSKKLQQPKLQSFISLHVQNIRQFDDISTRTTRKYMAFIIESLTSFKSLSHRDHLLLLYSLTSAVLKILEESHMAQNQTAEIMDLRAQHENYKEQKFLELYNLYKARDNLQHELDEERARRPDSSTQFEYADTSK